MIVSSFPNCRYAERHPNTCLEVFGAFILAFGTMKHALRECRGNKLTPYKLCAMYLCMFHIHLFMLKKFTEILSCRPSSRPTISSSASLPYRLPPSHATRECSVFDTVARSAPCTVEAVVPAFCEWAWATPGMARHVVPYSGSRSEICRFFTDADPVLL